jgi:hypothetical protein
MAVINKRGPKTGSPQRGNRRRFPYEPRVIGGKLLMPAELQAIHRYVVETPVLQTVTSSARPVSAPASTRTGRITQSSLASARSAASTRIVAVLTICAGSGQ